MKCRARSKSRWITWRLKEKGMAGDASWEKGLHRRAAAAQKSVNATGNWQPSVEKMWSELNELVRVIICFLTAHFFDTHFGFKGLPLTSRENGCFWQLSMALKMGRSWNAKKKKKEGCCIVNSGFYKSIFLSQSLSS